MVTSKEYDLESFKETIDNFTSEIMNLRTENEVHENQIQNIKIKLDLNHKLPFDKILEKIDILNEEKQNEYNNVRNSKDENEMLHFKISELNQLLKEKGNTLDKIKKFHDEVKTNKENQVRKLTDDLNYNKNELFKYKEYYRENEMHNKEEIKKLKNEIK